MSNAGYGVSFFGGLTKGMKEANATRKAEEKELKDEARQAAKDEAEAADRALRTKESNLRIEQTDLTLTGAKEAAARDKRERDRSAFQANFARTVGSLDPASKVKYIEDIQNNSEWFDDGTLTQFEKDAAGNPVIGADGTVKATVLDKATGKVIGEQPMKIDDVVKNTAYRLEDPDTFNKRIREAAAAKQKKADDESAAEAKHARDKELAGIRYQKRPVQAVRATRGQDFLSTRDALMEDGMTEDEATELALQTVAGRQGGTKQKEPTLRDKLAVKKGTVTVDGKPVGGAKPAFVFDPVSKKVVPVKE